MEDLVLLQDLFQVRQQVLLVEIQQVRTDLPARQELLLHRHLLSERQEALVALGLVVELLLQQELVVVMPVV
jgi:hypothetical protein